MANREIEVKLLIETGSFAYVRDVIATAIPISSIDRFETGVYADAYWPAVQADFARVRVSKEADITTKVTDKGTIQDRDEERVTLSLANSEAMMRILEQVTGISPNTLVWHFAEWGIGKDTVEISLVKNVDDNNRCFIEIEGSDRATILARAQRIKQQVSVELGVNVFEVRNSFYDIYVKKQGPLI